MENRNLKNLNTAKNHISSILNSKELLEEQRKVLKDYDKYNKARGLKINSRKTYLVALQHFSKSVEKPYDKITKPDLVDYFSDIREEVSANTFTSIQISLKAFFKWLDIPEVIEWINVKKVDNGLPKIVPMEDIKKLTDVCDNPRDRCLVMVLWETACRSSEAGNLNIGDITFDEFGAKVLVSGKTGERNLRLIDSIPDLKLWLSYHPFKNDKKFINKPLFISLANLNYGERLEGTGVYQVIAKLKERAEIERELTPHTIRRTRLTQLAKEGFTEAELRLIAGWTRGSQTPKFYIALTGEDVDKKICQKKGLIKTKTVKKKKPLEKRECIFCNTLNSPSAEICSNIQCSMPLDVKKAIELHKEREDFIRKFDEVMPLLKQIVKERKKS